MVFLLGYRKLFSAKLNSEKNHNIQSLKTTYIVLVSKFGI